MIHTTEILIIAGALGGLGIVVGGLKAADWLIGLKYKTKDDCDKCRAEIYKEMKIDGKLLTEVDTKVDMILEHFNIELKHKE